MADDLSLLLKIKGDAAGGKAAVAETRAAIASLRATSTTEFAAIQNAGSKAFSSLTDNLNIFVGQRIPLIGGAFVRVSENLRGFGAESAKVEKQTAKLVSTIEGLAKETGKTSGQITSFLTKFVQLETQAKRDTAAIEQFGVALAPKLIPQLEKAGEELATLSTASASAGAGIAAMAGPIAIAAVAIAALAAGAVLLVKGLFDLAVQAADFRGKMFDLAQQTGVNVETLSALEIVAKTTGGSIESIAQSLVVFQGKLDEAQDTGSKAGKIFAELGISTNNTEEAFRSALTQIAKMPVGFEQTNTAAELFGRRGGKQVLAILKELDGDLDGAIKKFREMGIIISTEDARAADEFNDQLAILHFQFRALLGKEVIPAALDALKDLSKTLKDNKPAIDAVGKSIGILAAVIGFQLKKELFTITAMWESAQPTLEAVAKVYERLAKAIESVQLARLGLSGLDATATGAGTIAAANLEVGGVGSVTLPGVKSSAFKDSLKASEDQAAKELEIQRHATENLRLDQERRGGDLIKFYRLQQEQVDARLATLQKQIEAERAAAEAAFGAGAIDQEDLENRKRDLDLRAQAAQNQRDEETKRLKLEKDRALIAEEIHLREQLSEIAETARQGELERLKAALDRQGITESSLLTKQLEFLKEVHQERLGIIDFEIKAEGTAAERKLDLLDKKKKAEQEYTDEFKRLSRERMEAIQIESQSGPGAGSGGVSLSDDAIGRAAGVAANLGSAVPPLAAATDAFTGLGDAIGKTLGLGAEAGQIFGDVLANAFSQLAQGVGGVIRAFVLFGKAEGGLKKFAAEMIAQIAAMAAVQAVYQLAQGLAWTALNFFFPNPAYVKAAAAAFASAAVFGSIAGVAAVAGRVVAGDSFSDKGGGGGGGGTGGGGGSSTPKTIEADRRSGLQSGSQVPAITIVMSGEASEAFNYKVVRAVIGDHRLNGDIRKMTESGES